MSSLWLGEDHLVYVRGSGLLTPFSEEYKRYRYRDIQAVSIAKTSRVVGIVFFILGFISCAGLMALVLWQIGDEGVTALKSVFLSVLSFGALAFAAGLVSHLILGPTCVCDIQTSLSRDRLRPLSRYLRAQQVVDRLSELVRDSQEELVGNRGRSGSFSGAPLGIDQFRNFHRDWRDTDSCSDARKHFSDWDNPGPLDGGQPDPVPVADRLNEKSHTGFDQVDALD